MTAFTLKLFALAAMVIDHTASILTESVAAPHLPDLAVEVMHIIGRAAFPLYAFLLAEGFRHTRDWRRYALRLLGLGVLSQFPYAFTINNWVAFSEMPWWRRFVDLNILFSLFLGVVLLAFLDTRRFDRVLDSWAAPAVLGVLAALFYVSTVYDTAAALAVSAALTLAARFVPKLRWVAGQAARFSLFGFALFWFLRRSIPMPGGGNFHFSFDYGVYALVLFAALYWARTPRPSAAVIAVWGVWCYFGDWWWVAFTAAAALCAARYNGQRGRDDHRLFYWAYPAHLLLLWGALALLA